jgi:diadenosine tetraphosphate (Ap4A) HIT family hydrolase
MALSGIPYDDDNVFKKIIEGTVPSYKIFETEHALAFLDAFPMVKGHSLLVPKATGYASIIDMPEDVAANVLKELPRLARIVKSATGCDGVNIVQNNHACAGQVVFHVHFPRAAPMGSGERRTGAPGEERGHDLGGCRHGAAPGHARHAVIA